MSEIKRVHKVLGRVRIVSYPDVDGYYVQVESDNTHNTAPPLWHTVARWHELSNAKESAAIIHKGIYGTFLREPR